MRRRLALLLALAAFAAVAPGCKRDAASSPSPRGDREPPVPAPAALVAEGTLRDPDAFWGRLRAGGGAALAATPATAAGVLLALAGADTSMAPLVAGGRPFHLAIGEAPGGGAAFAITMPLANPDEARKQLAARPGIAGAHPAVAITSWGTLVVASSPEELETLGAYAARTLPTRELPASSFELRADRRALARAGDRAAAIATAATAALADVARALLPPEVDASAVAACFTDGLRDTVGVAGDLAEARLEASSEGDQLTATATLEPRPGDNAARRRLDAMRTASAAPLLDAPRSALATIFRSDAARARAEDAAALGPCLGRALAPVLGAGGGDTLAAALASWARGRGDWETASYVAKPPAAGFVVRAAAGDRAAATAALRSFADLAARPSVGDAVRRMLPHRAGQDQPAFEAPPVRLEWTVGDAEIDVGLGQAAHALLVLAHPAIPLRERAPAEHAVGVLRADASFAAVVAPPGCCTGEGAGAAPLVVGWGRHGDDGRATLVVGDELLGSIVAQFTR